MKKVMIVLLVVALGGTGFWGYNQYQQNLEHSIFLENQFQRMFYDLIVDVENIQVNLAKAMITGTPKQNVVLFTDIKHLSYDAQEKLGQLPISHGDVSKTEKFLSQVGDLSMAMAKKMLDGKPLVQEEMDTLEQLHNYSNYLSEQLIGLQNEIADRGVQFGELRRKGNQDLEDINENMISVSFVNVEERMQEYPELIYDGPFSEHIKNQKPKLQGPLTSKEDIERIAEKFVNDGVKYEAEVLGNVDNTRIPAYVVNLNPKNTERNGQISMAVTKRGGKVLWMIDSTIPGEPKLSDEQALKIAQKFLNDRGYASMVPTYSEKYDGQMIVNFAYSKNDVTVYSDLVKVKISLDEGKAVGFDAEGYWFNHHDRKIDAPKIKEEEARNKVSMNAEIEDVRLALIPTEAGREILCYEFKARFKEDTFLIYVNAETGEEESILQLIIKEDGVLML